MRTRALVGIAVLALPTIVSAQVTRLPRPGERSPGETGSTPPREIPVVARDLNAKRARWSAEGYTLVSAFQSPSGPGDVSYSTFGVGTRADYRLSTRTSATIDMTYSPLGTLGTSQTAEVGTRFVPLPGNAQLKPFVDLRAAYLFASDRFNGALGTTGAILTGTQPQRYSRGLGAVAGTGMEMFVNPNFAVTVTGTALRSRLNVYRSATPGTIPVGTTYWATSFRFALGFKFSPLTNTNLAQNPMQ
jgi:hypothetical protein